MPRAVAGGARLNKRAVFSTHANCAAYAVRYRVGGLAWVLKRVEAMTGQSVPVIRDQVHLCSSIAARLQVNNVRCAVAAARAAEHMLAVSA